MKKVVVPALALAVLAALYLSSLYNYLLFHSIAEVFSIIIASGIFMVAWNSRRHLGNQYLLFIGIAFLFIGILDLAHTFSYKGMQILPGFDANAPTQLWIAARYLESLSLLAAPLMFRRGIRPVYFIAGYAAITFLILVSIFYWRIFPDCFLEGAGGLTPFKIVSEYIICIFLLASGALIIHHRRRFDPTVLKWLMMSIIATILSELAFTQYASVYGPSNLLGHYFKIVSFYGVYKAIIETGLAKPYELLFRDLKQSKERYHSLFIHMTNGFAHHEVIFDQNDAPVDYRFLEVNDAFEKLTGLTDVIGKRVTNVIPGIENDPVDWIGVYGEVAATGTSIRLESYSELLRKWYSVTAYCPTKGQFVTIFEDITQRKLAQEDLYRQREWLHVVLNSIGDAVITCDASGRISFLNPVAAALTGWRPETALDRPTQTVFRTINELTGEPGEDIVKKVLEEKRIVSLANHTSLITQDGSEVPIEDSAAPIRDAAGRIIGVVIVFHDVTEKRRNQEALREANEALEQKVRERTATLAQLVDSLEEEIELRKKAEAEFRLANSQLAERADQLRKLAGELTMAEQHERKRLSKVLHDGLQQHLAAAKLQLGAMGSRINETDLKNTAAEIESMIRESIQMSRSLSADLCPPVLYEGGLPAGLQWLVRRMREKNEFNVHLTMEAIAELQEDIKVLLFESVRELLFNAFKHARVSGARVHLEEKDGSHIRIIVSDEGVGFDPSGLEPMGDNWGGLGLVSIRERIGMLGGDFDMESAPGKGCRFALTVPYGRKQVGAAHADAPSLPEGQCGGINNEKQSAEEIRVLIADDHALFREGLVRLVNKEPDINVIGQACDGIEAIELACKLMPDVILMDVNMPHLNGIEATRRICRQIPRIRIIGLSMHENHDHALIMREAGAVGYKNKGCAASELVAAIRTYGWNQSESPALEAEARLRPSQSN